MDDKTGFHAKKAGREYSNKDNQKGNMVRAVPGGYIYLGDPAKRDAEARDNLRKAEGVVETNVSRRKWFGGGKDKRGFANAGRTDEDMVRGNQNLNRARDEVDKVQRYRQAIGKKP
jgi:hypothetical protein